MSDPTWNALERFLLDQQIATGEVRFQDAATLLLLDRTEMDTLRQQVEALTAENARLRDLLKRISEWDHMDGAADGAYWRDEIRKALSEA